MRKFKMILIGVMAFSLLASLSMANGLNLNSLGARALAMGGAFVGLADDYSTIFWNPAGMGFFNTMNVGLYGAGIMPSGKYSLTVPILGEVVNAKAPSKLYPGGLAAFYYPITENLVAGIGVFTPAGLGANWNGEDVRFLNYPFMTKSYEWSSKIAMITIAPGVAYRIGDMISVGATLNVNYAMFNISQWAHAVGSFNLGQYSEESSGWGLGGTFGVLVKPADLISFGLTVKTPTTIALKGTASISNLSLLGYPGSSEVTRDLDWPLQISGGLSLKPLPGLTYVADLQWTQWSKLGNADGDIENNYIDPIWHNVLMVGAGKATIPLHWSDALQIRTGIEYMVTSTIAVRLGYMHDPAPSPLETMNFLLPNYDFNTITGGVGFALGSLQFDLGLEYLMGGERNISYMDVLTTYPHAQPGTYNMNVLAFGLGVNYKF